MDYLNQILDEKEKANLQAFAENEDMFNAVKKALLALKYSNGVMENGKPHEARVNAAFSLLSGGDSVSDEQVGRGLKLLWETVQQIEISFNQIKSFKRASTKTSKKNEAI